ncbi:MAG: ABC transporter ATP-binding protein/permease [Clostridia bacterium]|nr:ABC transporter ATP-binding protein/permease [Clostridia bacterium]
MGKKPMEGHSHRPEENWKFHPELCKALEFAGLSTHNLIYSCRGDMDEQACYKDTFIFFDEKGLYIAKGTEELVKTKKWFNKKHHPLEPAFTIEEIRAIPVDDIDELQTERYVSTGRFIMSKDGIQEPLLYFSIGNIGKFENLCKAFNSMKETGEAKIPHDDTPPEGKCKKCGAPCPPDKDYCRKHNKTSGTAVRLIKFFGGHVPEIALIIFFMIIGSVVQILVPQISTRALYDDILANPNGSQQGELIKAVGVLVLSVLGIRVLNMGITMVQDYMSATVMQNVMYSIKLKIFEAMQRLSVSFYSSRQTGSLMDRVMRDANNIYWFFTDGVPRLVINCATLIGVLIVMFRMNVKLSLFVLLATPLLGVVIVLGDRLFHKMHHRVWVYHSKVSSMLSDNINGQRIIKAFAKEDEEYEKFSEVSHNARDAEIKLNVTEATLYPLLEVLVLLLTTVIIGAGGVMVAKGDGGMTTGSLLAFVVYLEMLKEPVGFLTWISNWWARCADSAQRVFEICDAQPEITEKENAVGLDNIRGDVDITELEFEYEPARPIINKLTLSVKGGDMLGIVGKTGAGKTTIANLIARIYDAKEGSVKIDGVDVKDLKLADLRKNIGLVSQDIYLFIGSIADNIRYAKPDATMSEVIAAAKAACAHDFIMKLPDAYQTRVGAGGQRLSGGEKQRISIARTIIQNPKILILDEATAAMDTETERNIQNSLSLLTKGRTTIAIAHRLSTLRDSDYLAVIDEGKITEYGTYNELIDMKGEFWRLYEIQNEALKTIGIGEDTYRNPFEEEGDSNESGEK